MKPAVLFTVLCLPLLIGAVCSSVEASGVPAGIEGKSMETGALPCRVGRQCEIGLGERFSVFLDSNPTTGYRWQLGNPLDEAVLQLVGTEYEAPQSKLLGAGGKEKWTFRAVGRGVTSITLEYVRPWEKGVPPGKTVVYPVRVE